jgi:hypothetical protein
MPVSTDHTNLRKAACFTPLKDIPSTQAIATIDSLLENQKLSKFPPAFVITRRSDFAASWSTTAFCSPII